MIGAYRYRMRCRRTITILTAVAVLLGLVGLLGYDTFFWPTVSFFGLIIGGLWATYWSIVWISS